MTNPRIKKVKEFWNKCPLNFAHLIAKKRYTDCDPVFQQMSLKGRTIIDFGCGGGDITKKMFDLYQTGKSICIDISLRNLEIAKDHLREYNVEFYLNEDQGFKQYKAYLFICFAVIHHMPGIKYFNSFIKRVNESEIPFVFLSIKETRSSLIEEIEDSYDKSIKEVNNSLKVSIDYLNQNLPNYEYVTSVGRDGSKAVLFQKRGG